MTLSIHETQIETYKFPENTAHCTKYIQKVQGRSH